MTRVFFIEDGVVELNAELIQSIMKCTNSKYKYDFLERYFILLKNPHPLQIILIIVSQVPSLALLNHEEWRRDPANHRVF